MLRCWTWSLTHKNPARGQSTVDCLSCLSPGVSADAKGCLSTWSFLLAKIWLITWSYGVYIYMWLTLPGGCTPSSTQGGLAHKERPDLHRIHHHVIVAGRHPANICDLRKMVNFFHNGVQASWNVNLYFTLGAFYYCRNTHTEGASKREAEEAFIAQKYNLKTYQKATFSWRLDWTLHGILFPHKSKYPYFQFKSYKHHSQKRKQWHHRDKCPAFKYILSHSFANVKKKIFEHSSSTALCLVMFVIMYLNNRKKLFHQSSKHSFSYWAQPTQLKKKKEKKFAL